MFRPMFPFRVSKIINRDYIGKRSIRTLKKESLYNKSKRLSIFFDNAERLHSVRNILG